MSPHFKRDTHCDNILDKLFNFLGYPCTFKGSSAKCRPTIGGKLGEAADVDIEVNTCTDPVEARFRIQVLRFTSHTHQRPMYLALCTPVLYISFLQCTHSSLEVPVCRNPLFHYGVCLHLPNINL